MSDHREDLKIEIDALEEEWLNQPNIFSKYCDLAVEADAKTRQAEEDLKVIRSELTQEAHKRLEKPTALSIEAYFRTHKKHIKAKEKWMKRIKRSDKFRNLIFAFNQRKVALENLVMLHGQNYFSTPRIKADRAGDFDPDSQRKREARSKIKKRSRRTA